MELALLGATEAAEKIRSGLISSEELVAACLEQIGRLEEAVGAWAHLDEEFALDQAREADRAQREGLPLGPLHGVPVGIKDIIDTVDWPTEDGTVLHAGRRPELDAPVISSLKAAGAVIMGKTVTTELAVYSPGKTRNPHNLERTPGGSSSGSAAAVACGMIPLALGTQTNGSVIRPASFCGVYGYKPTFGSIPRTSILKQSPPLDQVGVFARSVEDAAQVAQAIMGYDSGDPATRPRTIPDLTRIQGEEVPVEPTLALVKTPVWDQAEETTRAAFMELDDALEERCGEFEPPAALHQAHEMHRIIMEADLARSFAYEYQTGGDKLSQVLKEMIERGQKVSAVDYNNAVDGVETIYQGFDQLFEWHDAIITPATIGEAPMGLDATGSPIFCTIWTLCGMPAITLPLLQGENGMPLGVQLVGPRNDDGSLLRTARWLVETLTS